MTEKIIDYRKVSSPEQAKETVKYFENVYHYSYDWSNSLGEIEDAIAVCILETNSGRRYVTTTKRMSYFEHREVVEDERDIGGL